MRLFRVVLPMLAALLLSASSAFAQVVNVTATVDTSRTWGPTGSPGWVGTTFWVKNSISIAAGETLTIQPGVVVKFAPYSSLSVYGAIRAVGTLPSPIYFTSIKDDNNPAGDTNGDGNITVANASDWYGLIFPATSINRGSVLTYCNIKYTGYSNYGALTFQSVSDTVSNCTISKGYYGVDCQGTAAPVLMSTTIQASTMTPIVLDLTAAPEFSSLAFSSSDNGYDAIGLRGGTITTFATLAKRGALVGVNPTSNVTYVLMSSLTISATGGLTIAPGVVIKPIAGANVGITVSGNLTMNGTSTAGDTITITSVKDDNFGQPNDTNNNGSITAPVRGDWDGIKFLQGSTGSVSYCRLKFGTIYNSPSWAYGLIQMLNVSIPVSNTLLSDAGHGLAVFGTSSPAITNVQISNCSSTPILESVSATATYSGIGMTGNAITAIGIQGEPVAVNSHLTQRTLAGYTNMTYYIMNGMLQMLAGTILTVDAGVVVKNQYNVGTYQQLSGLQIDGALIANGTALNPIVFTSERDDQYGNPADTNGDGATTAPAVFDWSYIQFTDTSNDAACVINYCRITYASWQAGGGTSQLYNYNSNVVITNSSPTITNSMIFKGWYGMRVEGNSAPTVSANTFNNLSAAPIVMSVLSDPQIATNNIYTSNVYNALALMGETLSQDALLKYRPNVGNPASPTFCYLTTMPITVASGVTLSIQPTVVLKPLTYGGSSTAVFNINGALNMVGADNGANRIFVTSPLDDALGGDTTPTNATLPQSMDWTRIVFNDTAVDASCIVRNVKFQFGGSNTNQIGVLTTYSASPRFANLEFFQNGTAFTIAGNSSPSLDSLNILNCTLIPIATSLISSPSYGTHITFANCAYLGLGILGETVAQDVTLGVGKIGSYSNLNYILAGDIVVAFGAKWTIQPGVVIKGGPGNWASESDGVTGVRINISGALFANGKPDSLIIFTSTPDDAFGQDARGDGAAAKPSPGDWHGITFDAVSNDAATLMNHCRVRYGSSYYFYGNSEGSLSFVSAGPTITNTQISQSRGPAACIGGASTPTFTNVDFDSTTSVGYGVPVLMSLVSNPVFTNCRFQGNWYTALGVIPETIAQDVLWKIRPVAGRLNMPYFLNGALTVGLGSTLTMQPGVIVKSYYPNSNTASILIQRALTAVGRTVPESLIVFTSWQDDFYGGDSNADSNFTTPVAGDWSFVQIDGTAIDPQVVLRNCVFRFSKPNALASGALRCVNSAPTVDSCLFAYNFIGLSAEGSSNPLVRGSSFYGNSSYAINNSGNAFCVSATGCWWGAASGPNDASATSDLCSLGSNAGAGDVVSNNVNYTGFATAGVVHPVLGDVSQNGSVSAYDASLVLQSTVALITLSPMQALVADVDATAGVTAFDATLIQRLLAGRIAAFPPLSNRARPASDLPAGLRAFVDAARGSFELSLGEARRVGGEWLVPVRVTGSAPRYSAELALDGGDAALLVSVDASGGAASASNIVNGGARVAMAATDAIEGDEVMVLHFLAASGDFRAPQVTFARVNAVTLTHTPPPAQTPNIAFLGRPSPNPARGPVTMQLAVTLGEATPNASVRIVDVAGRTLRTLLEGPLAAGTRAIEWNLADDSGRLVPAGMYFVRARTAGSTFTQRLIVVR